MLLFAAFAFALQAQTKVDTLYFQELESKIRAYYVSNQDSANYYTDLMIEKSKDFDQLIWFVAYSNSNRIANYYNDVERAKANFKILDAFVITHKSEILDSKKWQMPLYDYYFDKGLFYYDMVNDENAAVRYFKKFEALKDKNIDRDLLYLKTKAELFLARIYEKRDQLSLAEEIYLKNKSLYQKTFPERKRSLLQINSLLGNVYQKQGKITASNLLFRENFEDAIQNNYSNKIVNTGVLLVQNYLKLNRIDSAELIVSQIRQHLDKDNFYRNLGFEAQADIAIAKGENAVALQQLDLAIAHIKKRWDQQKHPQIAALYLKKAKIYLKQNQLTEAKNALTLAENEVTDEKENFTLNQQAFLKILTEKTALNNQSQEYHATQEDVKQSIQLLSKLKPEFDSNKDKMLLIENAIPTIENGLFAVSAQHKQNPSKLSVNLAFYFIEKAKASLLMESMLTASATRFSNFPDSLLQKERNLRSKITQLESQMLEEAKYYAQSQLYDLKNQLRAHIHFVEENYADYYNLKYNSEVLALYEMQETLPPSTLFVNYFYGEKNIYAVVLNLEKAQLYAFPKDKTLEDKIQSLYTKLKNPKSDVQELGQISRSVYQKILAPILEDFPKDENLLLSPDGWLNYLPFSALNASPHELTYLIEKYATSYVSSATIYQQLISKKTKHRQLLAFAPNFKDDKQFAVLPKNRQESEGVLSYFDGTFYSDNQATLKNFNENYADYGMFHFATHAVINDDKPEYSYLVFEKDSAQQFLYLNDLYNYELNADLVTLSACETGIGKLYRGEGFISLSRGFYYAGTASIASTLWKINDGSTAEIMQHFYAELADGKPKHQALRKAQLQFIQKNKDNNLSHPYYWSAFVISGNTQPIKKDFPWMWLAIEIIAIVLFAGFWWKMKTAS